jgi:NIPSNAP
MKVIELRKYTLFEGASDAMVRRFETINKPLFADHGIRLEHALVDPSDSAAFYFLLSFDSRETRDKAWRSYHADPRFIAARDEQATIIKEIELRLLDPLKGSE